MKPITLFFSVIVAGALIAPFFLTINGKRLMTVDKFLEDSIPSMPRMPNLSSDSLQVYKWQDADGVWQFSQSPPANDKGQLVDIEANLTPVSSQFFKGPSQAPGPAQTGNTQVTAVSAEPELPTPGIGGLLQGKELMDKAESQIGKLNERQAAMDAAFKDMHKP